MDRRSFVTGVTLAGVAQGAALSLLTQGTAQAQETRATAPAQGRKRPGPIVETTTGKVRGLTIGGVRAFKGIPYGASTEGSGRFMPPQKRPAWSGVRDAFELGPRAPELAHWTVAEHAVMDGYNPTSEDCLCLNVWTRGVNDGGKRPVMVWFHGGGFTGGSGGAADYDGTNLASRHDVVSVTVNHRLNVFGYLYLAELGGEKYAHSSNLGMLDLIASLEWVRDNIAAFGGDPTNVTIWGQSGGGRKVSTLLGMPAAKGLFHRAIAMSGAAVRQATKERATKVAQSVLMNAGLRDDQVDELQKMSKKQLLAAWGGAGDIGPVVDGDTLPENPFDPVATPVSADVPLIIGSTETEATWNTRQEYDPLTDSELADELKHLLRCDQAGAEKVVAVYRRDRPHAGNLDLYLIAASDAGGERTETDTEAERKAVLNRAPVYKYYFQWYSPVRGGELRAMHTMDVPFATDNVVAAATQIGTGSDLQPLADKMSAAYVAFARTGNPNHKLIPQWAPFNNPERPTMIWNDECRVANNPFAAEKAVIQEVKGPAVEGRRARPGNAPRSTT